MHILHIASGNFFSTYGGGQVYVQNVCAEMATLPDTKVSVLSFVESPVKDVRHHNDCDIYECKDADDASLGNLIRKIAPDVIHAHSRKAQMCRIGKMQRIPVVVTAHHGGLVCPAGTLMTTKDEICQVEVCHKNCLKCCLRNTRTGLAWYPFVKLLPRKAYICLGKMLKRLPFIPFITPIGDTALSIENKQKEWQTIVNECSLMIAPCERIQDAMLRNGLEARKTRIVPHGIPLPDEVPPYPSTENGLKFFHIGRICYVKGLHVLLEAFHRLRNANVEMHLIGGAANKTERRYEAELKAKYGNDKRIIWHGKVAPNEIYDTIKNYHISSSSSYLETFGLNIAESLAIGKPVLSTRHGGAEMQIEDGVNGWLVPSNDVEAMRQKMEEIVTMSYEDLAQMAKKKHVVNINEHCVALLSIYKTI